MPFHDIAPSFFDDIKEDVASTQSALGSDVTSPNLSRCVCVKIKSGVVSFICLHVRMISVAAPP